MKKSKKSKKRKSKKEKVISQTNEKLEELENKEGLVTSIKDSEFMMDVDEIDISNNDVALSIAAREYSGKTSSPSLSDMKTNISRSPNMKILLKSKTAEKSKTPNSSKKSKKRDGPKGEDDTDSEEERWLDAIESGKLEEVDDELKRIKNPRLMTARQRALMEKRLDGSEEGYLTLPAEPLLALPSGFKEKVLTEEMLVKKAIKSKRRREQAQEKREEDKKKTVDRLLKKQDSKMSKANRNKTTKNCAPIVTYINRIDSSSLSLPVGFKYPLQSAGEKLPSKPKICGARNCFNIKKYSCSKTGVPLCSLQCYKKNLLVNNIIGAAS